MRKALITAVLMVAGAMPLGAEIALFVDGRSLKIEDYGVRGTTIELVLPSGGRLTLPLERIERIVDDEVAPPAIAEAVEEEGLARKAWRFDEERRPIFSSRYDEIIVAAARKFDVDAALISAVIKAESNYDPRAVSRKGAQGLMQLMPATARRFGVADSFDPVANIDGGTRYLRWLLEKFEGNAELVLAAYNAGEGNVWKYNGVPPFRETIGYVKRIARHLAAVDALHSVAAGG